MRGPRTKLLVALGYPLFGGLLLALAFPPANLFLLSLAAIAPLLRSLEGCGFWSSFRRGYIFGLAFGLPTLWWLQQFVAKWTNSWALGCLPWIVVSVLFAIYFGLFAAAAGAAWNRRHYWAIPLVWAGVEFARSIVPYIFFPWAQLGTTLTPMPLLLQPAWWGGVYFLGAWIVTFNAVLALIWKGEAVKRLRPLLLFVIAVVAGAIASYRIEPTGDRKWLAAVQVGVDMAFTSPESQALALAERVPKAMRLGSAVKRDLLVLPEHIGEAYGDAPPTFVFQPEYDVPFVVGVRRMAPEGSYQSLYGWDGAWHYADKLRLVIFGEYVPLREQLGFLRAFSLPAGDLRPADKVTTLSVAGIKVGGLVCFEGLFEEVARKHASNGAHMLVVAAMDDWYQGTAAIDQLNSGAILRAVENRLPIAKSSPFGPCFVADARGRVLEMTKPGSPAIARAEVSVGPSPVSPVRHVFPWIALAAWICYLIAPRRRGASRTSSDAADQKPRG